MMTEKQVGQLLAMAALFDNRDVTAPAAKAWHALIGHLDYADAVAALKEHYAGSTTWLMPAHVIDGVAALRERRTPPIPAELASTREEDEAKRASGLRAYVESTGVQWDAFKTLRGEGVGLFKAIEMLGGDPEGAK